MLLLYLLAVRAWSVDVSSATELNLIVDAIQRSVAELRTNLSTVDGKNPNALVSVNETVGKLQNDVALLHDKVKPRKGWLKTHIAEFKDFFTFVFSLAALFISLASLLLTYVWLDPDVHLVKGSAVEVTWDPQATELRLGFQITVANYGRRMDVVKSMEADLTPLLAQFQPINFTSRTGDFTLKSPTKTELSFPFTVADKTAMDVNTTVSQVLGTPTRDSLFQKPSQLGGSRKFKLKVHLDTASGKAAATEFCFEIPDYLLTEIAGGDTKEISTTECRGGQ